MKHVQHHLQAANSAPASCTHTKLTGLLMVLIKPSFYCEVYINTTTAKSNIYTIKIEENKHSEINPVSKMSGGKGRTKDFPLVLLKHYSIKEG